MEDEGAEVTGGRFLSYQECVGEAREDGLDREAMWNVILVMDSGYEISSASDDEPSDSGSLSQVRRSSQTISEMFILFLQTKRYNVSVFLNVNVALIYVATWRNEKKVNKKSNVSAISYYIDIYIICYIIKVGFRSRDCAKWLHQIT